MFAAGSPLATPQNIDQEHSCGRLGIFATLDVSKELSNGPCLGLALAGYYYLRSHIKSLRYPIQLHIFRILLGPCNSEKARGR
jgi:hypothetical protein